MRRFVVIASLVLLVTLAVTVGVAWYLLEDEAFLKSRLSSLALKHTGRELTLEGPLEISLGSVTSLEANKIRFANAAWADEPDMVVIGQLKISVELSSLFDDRIVIPAFSLEDCKILLTRNEEGEANWDVISESKPAEPPADPEAAKQLPLRLSDIQVHNCELVIASVKLDHPLKIEVSALSMQQLDNDRWQSKASGKVNEKELSLDGWFAPFHAFVHGGPLEHEFKITLDEMTAQSSGSVADARTGAGANITTRIQGPEIAVLLEEFKLPPFSEGAFDYHLRLNTEGEMTRLDLDGDIGSLNITADGELDRLVHPGKGNVNVSIDGPNLGALARVFGLEGWVESEFHHKSTARFSGDTIHLGNAALATGEDELKLSGHISRSEGFAGSELDIHLKSSEAGRWAGVAGKEMHDLGELTLDGKLSSDSTGLFSVQVNAALAAATLEAGGEIGHFPDKLKPRLDINFSSPDPSKVANFIGLPGIPAVPLSISGQAGFVDNRVQFDGVKINLAGDTAAIDGHINLTNRYSGSEANIHLDIANVDQLALLFGQEGFPDQPLKLAAVVKPDGKGLNFKVGESNIGAIKLNFEGSIADLDELDGLDANFDVSLPRLSDISFLVPGTELPAAPFSAHGRVEMKDKKIRMDEIRLDLAGNKAEVDGRLNLADRYAGSEVTVNVDVQNAHSFGQLFNKEGLPNQPLKLSAVLKPEGKGLGFQVNDGNLGEIQLDLEGRIADLDQPTGVDARFDIRLTRLSDISFLLPDRPLPDVPFTASGRLHNRQSFTGLDQVQITLGQGTASIDGKLLPDNNFQLDIRAAGVDASNLDRLVGTSLPAASFRVATKLSGDPSQFSLTGLDASLGESQVKGNLEIGLGDPKRIHGNIESPYLDLGHWVSEKETEEAPAKDRRQKEWMFDDTPVLQLTDHGMEIDVDLRVDTLFLGNTTVNDIALNLVLDHQRFELKPFTFKGTQGGSYHGEFSLDGTAGTPELLAKISGKDVRLGLAALPDQDPSTIPPMEIELHLAGVGTTRREMATSLDGKYRAYLGRGQVASAGLDLLFSDFLTQLFNTLNPFHENSEYTQLDCAVFAATVDSGIVTVFPVIMHTDQLTILSEGIIDLNTEDIDLSFNTKPRKGLGISAGALINPLIKVGGRLTTPAVELDPGGTVVSGGLAIATIGISVLAKSMSDRFLSSKDPCGEARRELEKIDSAAQ